MAGRGRTVTAEVAALLMAFCALRWHCGDGVRAKSALRGNPVRRTVEFLCGAPVAPRGRIMLPRVY